MLFNPFPNKPWFLNVCSRSTSLLKKKKKTVVKGEIARNEQFLLFPHIVFYPFVELSAIFVKFEIVVCKFFQFESLKFAVWKGFSKWGLNAPP